MITREKAEKALEALTPMFQETRASTVLHPDAVDLLKVIAVGATIDLTLEATPEQKRLFTPEKILTLHEHMTTAILLGMFLEKEHKALEGALAKAQGRAR